MPASVLVVVAGPIAAGKTTVARALVDSRRARGHAIALVGLDDIAAMAEPIDWPAAHGIFASVVGGWLRASVETVVAEGPGSPDELRAVLHQASPSVRTVVCVIEAPFDTAFARASDDPTRGVSRDPAFLADEYTRWAEERTGIDADVRVDAVALTVEEAVRAIEAVLDRAP